jgi:serine/threonine-protein kinase
MEIRQIGRYEIQHRLGKGGMGSLYLARDPGLDRLVAIKLLKDDYLDDQEFRERFAREARALARLRHPNIVVVYDFGEHDGRPFMAMEYIDGETLRQRLARTPPLKIALGLALVEDLCAGLANAHDAGIVHRDIKPDNIMVDRQGVVKLLDFGIARNAHAESTHQMTQPGMIMGTYNYMSPEQLLGEMVDKRSDIFAVGAVLYQVIAREQAFPGAFGAVYHRVLTAGPVPLEERVPAWIRRWCGL